MARRADHSRARRRERHERADGGRGDARARHLGRRFYNFDGLDALKAKLRPDDWEPIFAISVERRFSVRKLYAIAAAFSAGSPVALVARALWGAARHEARTARRRLIATPARLPRA